MHFDKPQEHQNQPPQQLLAAISRLPKWERGENSLYGSMFREESLIVQPEDLFSRNNRDKENYCEQQSDLRTLDDWIQKEDDMGEVYPAGFGHSRLLAEERAAEYPIYEMSRQAPKETEGYIRIEERSYQQKASQQKFSSLETVSVEVIEHRHEKQDAYTGMPKPKVLKESFVKNLQTVDDHSRLWEIHNEGKIGHVREPKEARPIPWRTLISNGQQYSFSARSERCQYPAKRRIFDQSDRRQDPSTSERRSPYPQLELMEENVPSSTRVVFREVIKVQHCHTESVQPLLDELLISKQRETALSRLSMIEDDLICSLRSLCTVKLEHADKIREQQIQCRHHLLALSEQIERHKKHLKHCYLSRYLQAQRDAESILKLVAIPINFSKTLSKHQLELETIVQNILSASVLEKLIKGECVIKFMNQNRELLKKIEEKEVQGPPPFRIECLEGLKQQLYNDLRQIEELLQLIPDLRILEEEFTRNRQQELRKVKQKLQKGQYTEVEREHVVEYLHSRIIHF